MGIFKKKTEKAAYDAETEIPVIKTGICTGEQVAGFKNKNTGKIQEVMLIRDQSDLRLFLESYGLKPEDIKKEY